MQNELYNIRLVADTKNENEDDLHNIHVHAELIYKLNMHCYTVVTFESTEKGTCHIHIIQKQTSQRRH